jgi:ABC-type Fe3+-hydroxamate transport system substrate-binding protein
MKTIRFLLAIAMFIPAVACYSQSSQTDNSSKSSGKIEAYYFHFNVRCATCRTVEAQAKEDIETLYPDMVKEGKITFQAINLDDASSKATAEKLDISGQTLLLVKGDLKINLTNEGFMYAVSNPEKLKSIIKEKVDGLIKM